MAKRTVLVLDSPRFAPNFEASFAIALDAFAADGADLVLVHDPLGQDGPLDPFVVLAGMAEHASVRIGAAITLGAGRAASIAVREATSLEHLSHAGGALGFISDDATYLTQAMAVATALLSGEARSAGGDFEHIVEAPNRPGPRQPFWLVELIGGRASIDGEPAELRILEGAAFG